MGQAGMGSYYGPAAAYGSLSAASMAAAAAAAAQQSAAAMSAGLAAPAQVSQRFFYQQTLVSPSENHLQYSRRFILRNPSASLARNTSSASAKGCWLSRNRSRHDFHINHDHCSRHEAKRKLDAACGSRFPP